MKKIDLNETRLGFNNKPFSGLIKNHLNTLTQETRIQAMISIFSMLPENARPLVKDFLNRWDNRIYDENFWQTPCVDVFDEIIKDAKKFFAGHYISFDDEALFNIFSLVALNYTYTFNDQPKLQERLTGARKLFMLAFVSRIF